jgi:pimeloyl-ACP methyl ester carboxylesterase
MATSTHIRRGALRRTLAALLISATALITTNTAAPSSHPAGVGGAIRLVTIHYTAHNGADRLAYVLLPAWYGPKNNPLLPVVISPHGRNANGRSNSKYFGNLPAVGTFAVISPDGMGRRDTYKSYAYEGQIDDLAKMPDFAVEALPWLQIDRSRIYALGSSMGGHETLMLIARHPQLLAGAAAMDSVTDLPRRYSQLPGLPCDPVCLKKWGKPYGFVLQAAMRREVGGTPTEKPRAYAARSPVAHARTIADAGVPLQIWWSHKDLIVFDQKHQSEALVNELRQLNPCAPVSTYAGRWPHSKEMRASQLLPIALGGFDLLPRDFKALPKSVRHQSAPVCSA